MAGTFQARNVQFLAWDFGRLLARVTVQTGNIEFLAWRGTFKPETLSSWLGRDRSSQKRTVSGLGFWSTPGDSRKAVHEVTCCTSSGVRGCMPDFECTTEGASGDSPSQKPNVPGLAGSLKPETLSSWLGRTFQARNVQFLVWQGPAKPET